MDVVSQVRWCWLVIAGLFVPLGNAASATETEVREFSIQVGGKAAGQCVMTMKKEKDGMESMSAQANVRVKVLLINYTFTLQGSEVWKNGKLQQLQTAVNDNGKKLDLTATVDGDSLRVRVNGKEHACRGDAWTSSYWKLPDAKYFNKAVTLLEADTGKELNRQLQYVGIAPVNLGGKDQNCYHFRVTGGTSPIDLWYDGQLRLVRQEFVEDGHRTILLLTGLRRN